MVNLNYPTLDEPYATGLREATDYLLEQFGDSMLGIIVAGSVLRGNGDEYSDIDTFVILDVDYRQRIQKFFNGVRFELLCNAVPFIEGYFEEEKQTGGASTAHMLATGHVLLKQSSIVDKLIEDAVTLLDNPPTYSDAFLTQRRYFIADNLENGFDLRERDPLMGITLINSILKDMLIYYFQKDGHWIPRSKDLLAILRDEAPALAQLVEQYHSTEIDKRFDIAGQIADMTIGVRGFFEWDSGKDYLS